MSGIISTVLVILIFLGIVVAVILWAREKIRKIRIEEEMQQREFQLNMEREFGAVNKEKKQPHMVREEIVQSRPAEPVAPEKISSAIPAKPEEGQPEEKIPFMAEKPGQTVPQEKKSGKETDPVEEIILQITEAGLFKSREGTYPLLDPSGECVLIKMKKDKSALIVPRYESEYFTGEALKRFDYVIFALPEKRWVVTKQQDFIAGQFGGF